MRRAAPHGTHSLIACAEGAMGHPLSQTPGALRKRAWRERVTRMGHPLSQTPEAQRERLRRDGLSSLGNLVDQKDLSRPARPCSCCGVAFQPTMRRRMLCGPCYRLTPG